LQVKLDELIRAIHDARNAYMGIEKLLESKLEEMRDHCAETGEGEPQSTDKAIAKGGQ
jgi:low affinity Fe/Cu permease